MTIGNRIENLVTILTPKPFILQSLTVRIPYKTMFQVGFPWLLFLNQGNPSSICEVNLSFLWQYAIVLRKRGGMSESPLTELG